MPAAAPPSPSARSAIEESLLHGLLHPPCYVLFSGGRDSSALLAVAVWLARREGLDLPVPVTIVHRDAGDADESEWQSLVLDHLALSERLRLDFDGEQRLLAPAAAAALQRHGLVWPEAVQLHGAAYERLGGVGSVVSGEGGDDVVGTRRVAAARDALARPWARRDAETLLAALTPAPLARRQARRELLQDSPAPWLTPAGKSLMADALSQVIAEPLRADRALVRSQATRINRVFATNFETAIREYGLRPVNPFLAPTVVAAVAREGGVRGLGTRTQMMRHLFADLLPDAILARGTKAAFNETRWGEAERSFAENWDGTGVDPTYIVPEQLQDAWRQPDPAPGADFQLHAAWLASGTAA